MGGHVGAMGGPKVLLLVLLIGWEDSACLNWNPVPRKTIKYHGELSLATLQTIRYHSELSLAALYSELSLATLQTIRYHGELSLAALHGHRTAGLRRS